MNLRLLKILAWPICLIFLIGIIFAGNNNILCMGDNGSVLVETFCPPCCDQAEKTCKGNMPDELHNEPCEYSNCSDVEINGPFWSKRIQITDSNQLNAFASKLTISTYFSPISIGEDNLQILKYYLAYGQSPPIYSIISLSTTVFRC